MFQSILKIAIRNLWRNKFYSLINIIGLSVGLAAVILITLYIVDESNYDKMYSDYDKIYRVESKFQLKSNEDLFALAPHPLAPAMKAEIPEIESYTRVRQGSGLLYYYKDKQFFEEGIYLVDSTYLDIFDINLIAGNKKTALSKPNSMVVSRSFIEKYFSDEDPLGKSITNEGGGSWEITGIYEDLPFNMHLRPEALASYHTLAKFWGGEDNFNDLTQAIQFWRVSAYTYIKLKDNNTINQVNEKFPAVYEKYMAEMSEQIGETFDIITTRVDNIYHSAVKYQADVIKGNYQYVVIMFLVGLMIILLAAINYMNLATARSSNRTKEVAIRKVVGSSNSKLVFQFIFEAILLSVVSFIISLASVEFMIDMFNSLSGKHLDFYSIFENNIFLYLLGITIIIGLVSGLYPAFYLSKFEPTPILRGNIKNQLKSGWLRKVLVVTQFAISITLIIGTWHLIQQFNYLQEKELGYNKDNIMLYRVRPNDTTFYHSYESFKTELLKKPCIKAVATGSNGPGSKFNTEANKVFFLVEDGKNEGFIEQACNFISVDENYIDLMEFKMLEGRQFNKAITTEGQQSIIVNKAMAERFSWGDDIIGRKIRQFGTNPDGTIVEWSVIGVLDDFHYRSLNNPIEPLILFFTPATAGQYRIKMSGNNISETIDFIEEKVKEFGSDKPFIYSFVDQTLAQYYQKEERMYKIFMRFTIVALIISCLGLLGLSAFVAEQKTKEIGIRKVLGASVPHIVGNLSLNFVMLVVISNIFAFPLAYILINEMIIDKFLYHINMDFISFFVAMFLAIFVAFITVSWLSIKAALSDPVKSLKYE